MLLHIKDFYSNYTDVTAGFIPEMKVRFEQPVADENIGELINEIKNSHEVENIQYGYIKKLDHARFALSSGRHGQKSSSLDKNISIIGINYDAGKQIEFFQGRDKFEAEVVNIEYFGNWFINIKKDERLKKSGAHLYVNGQRLNLEVIDLGKYYSLQLSEPESSEQVVLLYDFMAEFAERFVTLQNTGIPHNRFEVVENQQEDLYTRKVFIKRKLLGLFSLVFPGQGNDINSLLSSQLYHNISKYNKTQKVALENGNQSYALRIIDFFNLNAEKFYNNNAVLMNYKDFSRLFGVEDKINVLFLYGNGFSREKVVKDISSHYPDADFIFRHDAVPTLNVQTKIVEYSILFLLILFFIVVCSIIIIRLLKFYMVFKYEIIFMKLYGYKGLTFSNILTGLFLASLGAGYAVFKFMLHWSNKILSSYYFPEIQMNVFALAAPALICAAIITGSYFLEKWQFDNLEYSRIGST
ncbi:MAG: hypothetical protein ACOC90_00050 [Bacteroidota bacterium]